MTLLRFKKTGRVPGHDDHTHIEGRCWAIGIDRYGLHLEHQCMWQGKWSYGSGYYGVGARWAFKFGRTQMYYDGYHNSIDFGPFYVTWLGWTEWKGAKEPTEPSAINVVP